MEHYFRITAYHPKEDISAILDSCDKFEKLWQFSAYLIEKGFKILEVCAQDKIAGGNFPLMTEHLDKIYLRAAAKGQPTVHESTFDDKPTKIIGLSDKAYGQYI